MAFKTLWECEYCGHEIWSNCEPDETECDCYEAPEVVVDDTMSKEERDGRYKEAYRRSGYSWHGSTPYMYMGKFGSYKSRES